VNFQDLLAADHVGFGTTTGVETAGAAAAPDRARRAGWSRNQNDAFVGFKAVHLDSNWLSVCSRSCYAAQAGAAMTADRVDFVDEDDAGRSSLACSNMSRTREAPSRRTSRRSRSRKW